MPFRKILHKNQKNANEKEEFREPLFFGKKMCCKKYQPVFSGRENFLIEKHLSIHRKQYIFYIFCK